MAKKKITVKATGEKYVAFVIKDYYGKGKHAYNPMWHGGMYKINEIHL